MGELLYLETNKLSFIERAKHVDISTRQGKREIFAWSWSALFTPLSSFSWSWQGVLNSMRTIVGTSGQAYYSL